MERPVSEHIQRIREFVEKLSNELKTTNDKLETHRIENDIRSLNLALAHYELALKLEDEVLNDRAGR